MTSSLFFAKIAPDPLQLLYFLKKRFLTENDNAYQRLIIFLDAYFVRRVQEKPVFMSIVWSSIYKSIVHTHK